MTMILRLVLGLAGLIGLLVALRTWVDPVAVLATFAMEPVGALGRASARADFGGFFMVAGGFMLAAAIRKEARLLTPALALIGAAFAGRLVTVALDGWSADMGGPMALEAGLLVLMAVGRSRLPRK